ncbi:MAG: helix-turn-helix domain-containing protein [Candidatus Eisenbacteria bacterium]|nr:helix-turn-helix domain-containing protein [Candidatus Eisenbacteria bacterium]
MPDRSHELDQLIHAPVRLRIMTTLAEAVEADFVHLREETGTTDGNLSRHLTKLEEAGYVRVRKGYEGRKPRTTVSMTKKGRRALLSYLSQLEAIVERARRAEREA